MDRSKLKTYFDHFLPREVIGPVVIVFSLEGVIDGVFGLYIPPEYETMAWAVIFFASVWLVAKWGLSVEEEKKLEEKLEN
ncbi:MAG: hypothetical protein ABEK10_02660 [Candidatus Nanosalina sp.]